MPHAPLVIVNPTAGGGRGARLVPWLRERVGPRSEIELRVTSRPGEAEMLAGQAAGTGRDRVVAVGGDGTVQEVLGFGGSTFRYAAPAGVDSSHVLTR